jgi:hypothetical protein
VHGLYGTFHDVSEAHLHCCLTEYDFRYNHQNFSDVECVEVLLRSAKG